MVTIYRQSNGEYAGYQVSGHALAESQLVGKNDTDLVCGAVSVLAITGYNALKAIAGIKPKVETRNGFLRCVLPKGLDEEKRNKAQIVLGTIIYGLKDINNDPERKDYIQIVNEPMDLK